MKIKRKIKVLIVDDSMLFRETLAKAIARDPAIEVVAKASDPYEARDLILKHEPDVMTLDVELPRMNGIEFLKKLMPQYPIPVIVVSSISDSIFDALDAGAVDFVVKPNLRIGQPIDSMVNELVIKIKIASTVKVGHWKNDMASRIFHSPKTDLSKIVAIGASTGGTEALASLLKALPREMPGIVIVQHMPPVFTKMYAERLNNSCSLEVKEAATGDEVYPGKVLIAPGDYHMVLKKKSNTYYVDCYKGEKVSGHCPSVDVLFNSVAEHAKAKAVGVILTGMGADGAQGLLKMRQAGARTIGQDEESSIVYGMPKVAYEIGAVERQASLANIPNLLYNLVNEG
ncbi:MAG TPA: chemotaxis response regulator protein-glutamate methylesterase [Bacillota bacterium]|jgi:two-component system chemotaxis response regulator CheB|nr:chemotaxis response regulator protein-glutamate methylesterase [Bacillota bacterium]HOL09153.1 chemotaxis response regulator protein-glutamate methylesterase [Bacillota bacterium]HPO96828.1 chemotaxis response regulator protein-glutamate methylesterase [Bacillota bacterium]